MADETNRLIEAAIREHGNPAANEAMDVLKRLEAVVGTMQDKSMMTALADALGITADAADMLARGSVFSIGAMAEEGKWTRETAIAFAVTIGVLLGSSSGQ